MQRRAFLRVFALFVAGFTAALGALSYWLLARAGELAQRLDNPRLTLARFQQPRGRLLDRRGELLAVSEQATGGFYVRRYPQPSLGPLIGLLSPQLGATGLEQAADQFLRGAARESGVPADADDLVAQLSPNPPAVTADVVLTIDADLQRAAEAAFGDGDGAVIVLDPRSGAILAAVSRPTFDPNPLVYAPGDVAGARRAEAAWQELQSDGRQPLLFRPLQGLYTPGSTFKTVTLAAALARRVMTPASSFSYSLNPPNRQQPQPWHANQFVSCHNHTALTFDLTRAYAYSCNVAFSEVGLKIGAQAYQEAMRAFGLGEQPPLEVPAEASLPSRRPDFFTGDEATFALASTAMGQGELAVTPLLMALIVAAIANDGAMPAPYLMSEARSSEGSILWRHTPSIWKRPLDRATAAAAKAVLVASVEEGWARAAKVPGVLMGGKTGTAELGGDGEPHAWFIGFAPAESPQFAIAVVKEHAGYGSAQAAPVARAILAAALGR